VICAVCGEEVRWGWRPGPTSPTPPAGFMMHREEKDHQPILGQRLTAEMVADIERQLDEPRLDADGNVYTTRAYDQARWDKKRPKHEEDEEVVEVVLPEPEVWSTPIVKGDPRMPGGAATILNLMAKNAWSGTVSYSRGPRTHKTYGTLLSVADYAVLRARVDEGDRRAVAFWVDGKFDHSWTATADLEARKYHTNRADFNALKSWIRGE
jgi:hypothetical protein